MGLDQIGDAEQITRTLMRSHIRPFALLEGLARSPYGVIDVSLVAFGNQT